MAINNYSVCKLVNFSPLIINLNNHVIKIDLSRAKNYNPMHFPL